jgi:DNA-directed RNA polymerase subunit alpha
MPILTDTELLKVNYLKGKDAFEGSFVIEPLMPGYGLTIGHALRRVLLSSLSGAAIHSVRIDGVTHEFSTLPGVKEDVIEIIMNLKNIDFKLDGDEPVTLKLEKKGAGVVRAKDFQKNSSIVVINTEAEIATLDSKGKISMEVVIKKGQGYEPVERRKEEKMPLGTIAVDSVFTPIKKIHYNVENTRVGGMTNYDRVTLNITTDGSITPEDAFNTANQILIEHFNLISERMNNSVKKEKSVKAAEAVVGEKPKKAKAAKIEKLVKKDSKITKKAKK